MGDREIIRNLLDEFICPLCLQYFRHPVTTDCGHSFCQICLRLWERNSIHFSCPECREVLQLREYMPTLSLLNQIDVVKLVESYLLQKPEEQLKCQRHQKLQKLFCFDDETAICVSCSESQEHEGHALLPISEAVEYYKRQHWDHLDNLWELLECLQETLTKEMERPLSWSVVWTSNKENPGAVLKTCVPAILQAPGEYQEEEEHEIEEFLDLETQEAESELESEEDETVEDGLQMLNAQQLEMFQQLKKREAKEMSKMLEQREEWKTTLEQQIKDLQEVITELEQKSKGSDKELLQGVTDRLKRSEALLLQGWESFSPKLSNIYLIMATTFLLKFQESPVVKNCKSYEFSDDKKRCIIFIPDGSSGDLHAIYTFFNSQESQKIISRNLIYFNVEEGKVYGLLQRLSSFKSSSRS